MLTKLEITNDTILSSGVAFDPSGSASTDLIHIRNIEGIDAVGADVSSTPYGVIDGGIITGANIALRNIVLTVGFNPDPYAGMSVAALRDEVYAYFMPKSNVTLTFYRAQQSTVKISGVVERCEANHFSSDPEVQISVLCANPNFQAVEPSVVNGICLSAPNDQAGNYTIIEYPGNKPTGFTLQLEGRAASLVDSWNLKTAAPQLQEFQLYAHNLTNTQDVLFSSIPGSKYIKTQSGVSLLNKVPPDSDWLVLYPGYNLFAVSAEALTIATNSRPIWTMTYYPQYGGV